MRAFVPICVGLSLALTACAGRASVAGTTNVAQPRWETLPPTPALPRPERQGYVPVDGARLWYGEFGVRNGGTPVLLLHGGLGNASYFGDLIPDLVRAGYRVIAMDSRGHGRSSASSLPYRYTLMAHDVVAVLDNLRIVKADIVGWSDGGSVGYQLCIIAPDRVRRLLAFGANASLDGLKSGYGDSPTFQAYIARTAEEYLELSPDPTGYPAFQEAISAMWATDPVADLSSLHAVSVPVTVMVSQYDEAMKVSHAEAISEAIPNSNLVVLPNVSHFALLQSPKQFDDAVLTFLAWR